MVIVKAISEIQVEVKTLVKELRVQRKLLNKINDKLDHDKGLGIDLPEELSLPVSNLQEMGEVETLLESKDVSDALVSTIKK